jgi:dTMP kinase
MENLFVVLEGIDGTGKNTQCAALEAHLKKMGVKTARVKYPSAGAKKIHQYLAGKKEGAQDEIFEEYIEDIKKGQGGIKKALLGGWVLADRYCISTAAYQGVGGKLERRMQQIEMMNLAKADIVLWLDMPAKEAMKRKNLQKLPDKHEADFEFLSQVAISYEKLCRASFMAKKWARIDASKPPEEVFGQIKKALGI